MEFMKIIDDESERLARLIDSILEISRIESGRKEISLVEFEIVAVVKRVLTAMKPLAEKKSIKLSFVISEGVNSLVADEGRVESVVTNLVNNAIKFTPDGGSIDISVQQVGEDVRISVTDTGVGIPKEALGKIFDRFYRVRRTGSRVQGTGLGLAIVKEIVAMHGGRIEVESEEGRGSKFTIILPLVARWQPDNQTINQLS
jgi:two-component system phosphate regulon sensor histidine kinase PhoR